MERTSSAKLDEMLNIQKVAFNKTGLRYVHSLFSCSTSSSALNNVVFVSLASNDKLKITEHTIGIVSEDKHDKGKSILGAPPKVSYFVPENPFCYVSSSIISFSFSNMALRKSIPSKNSISHRGSSFSSSFPFVPIRDRFCDLKS